MTTIKINWGAKITLLYIGFITLIITLVAGSMKQKFDLVSDDYYMQELKYQDVIDADKNLSSLSTQLHIQTKHDELLIHFPREFTEKNIVGAVHFYSPVNKAWDRTIALSVNNNIATIKRKALEHTNYTAKIAWTSGGKAYYQETTINLGEK